MLARTLLTFHSISTNLPEYNEIIMSKHFKLKYCCSMESITISWKRYKTRDSYTFSQFLKGIVSEVVIQLNKIS